MDKSTFTDQFDEAFKQPSRFDNKFYVSQLIYDLYKAYYFDMSQFVVIKDLPTTENKEK